MEESGIYQGYYDYFKALPSQNEAVYALIHWQLFERKDYNQVKEQNDLLSLHDMEAVDLFMCSLKIGAVIIDGCINYNSETKLKDSSLAIGEAYYEEIFNGQDEYNVAYKGDYISRFRLNDGMTYLKHNDVLEKNEIAGILKLCEHYTKVFVEANECLKEMMEKINSK